MSSLERLIEINVRRAAEMELGRARQAANDKYRKWQNNVLKPFMQTLVPQSSSLQLETWWGPGHRYAQDINRRALHVLREEEGRAAQVYRLRALANFNAFVPQEVAAAMFIAGFITGDGGIYEFIPEKIPDEKSYQDVIGECLSQVIL